MTGAERTEAAKERAVSSWNIANAVTTLRILLVPLFAVVLLWDGGHNSDWRYAATALFLVAALTDRLDGELARRLKIVTDFGKIADPIADKALVGAALIGLSFLGDLPWWVSVVILVREIGITIMRFAVIRHGVIAASRGGKVKTVVQIAAIAAFIIPWIEWSEPFFYFAWGLMITAIVVTVVTGIDYVLAALRLARAGQRQ